MLFNTIDYFIFFIIVLTINYVLPRKIRYIWLLIVSYYFYMQWNPWYSFLILGTTIITFWGGIFISQNDTKDKRIILNRIILCFCLAVLLGILGYFKCYGFFLVIAINCWSCWDYLRFPEDMRRCCQ